MKKLVFDVIIISNKLIFKSNEINHTLRNYTTLIIRHSHIR